MRELGAIGDLVQLFNSQDPEVRRYATGATRNIIYENKENKTALIEKDGIQELVKALEENDDELRKNITGIATHAPEKHLEYCFGAFPQEEVATDWFKSVCGFKVIRLSKRAVFEIDIVQTNESTPWRFARHGACLNTQRVGWGTAVMSIDCVGEDGSCVGPWSSSMSAAPFDETRPCHFSPLSHNTEC